MWEPTNASAVPKIDGPLAPCNSLHPHASPANPISSLEGDSFSRSLGHWPRLRVGGTSGGGGFYRFLPLSPAEAERCQAGLHHSFVRAKTQRASPLRKAARRISTMTVRQRLPSGSGPPPETRGGTQKRATTARISAGTNRNASKAYCALLCENSPPCRKGDAKVLPKNQHNIALPSSATAPRMRSMRGVIVIDSSVAVRLQPAEAPYWEQTPGPADGRLGSSASPVGSAPQLSSPSTVSAWASREAWTWRSF